MDLQTTTRDISYVTDRQTHTDRGFLVCPARQSCRECRSHTVLGRTASTRPQTVVNLRGPPALHQLCLLWHKQPTEQTNSDINQTRYRPGGGETTCPPLMGAVRLAVDIRQSADGFAIHTSPLAGSGSQHAYSLRSCAMGQTDRQTDHREIGSSNLNGCEGNCWAWQKVMAAYRWVCDSRHLQADCQEPGSAPEPSGS